jgi:hypothetical protein
MHSLQRRCPVFRLTAHKQTYSFSDLQQTVQALKGRFIIEMGFNSSAQSTLIKQGKIYLETAPSASYLYTSLNPLICSKNTTSTGNYYCKKPAKKLHFLPVCAKRKKIIILATHLKTTY